MIKIRKINKQGATGTNLMLSVLIIVALVAAGSVAFLAVNQTAQQALGSSGDTCTENRDCRADLICTSGKCIAPAAQNPTGKASTLRVSVFDKASLSLSQVATGIHFWTKDNRNSPDTDAVTGYKRLTSSNQQSSAAAVTTLSTTTGRWAKGVAFNRTTYYGKVKEFLVTDEVQNVELETYNAVDANMSITVFDNNGQTMTNNAFNASVPANGDYTFDRIKLRQNSSQEVFVFGGLAFNTPEGSNLTISSTNLETYGKKVVRLGSAGDWILKKAEPLWMNQNDEFDIDNIKFKTSGVACGSTQEPIYTRILDWSLFEDKNAMLAEGFEDDAATPNDVGQGDFGFALSCGP